MTFRCLASRALVVLIPILVLHLGCTRAVAQERQVTRLGQPPRVKLGIDVLQSNGFKQLAGKRVGLVANPASVDGQLHHTADVLFNAKPQVNLVALFGPEHGVYGDEYAGDKVGDKKDARTGLPALSLYGKTQRPTKEMLARVDALVFDLQDIGSRSYTYVSTLRDCLEACAEHDKELIILDRPNPLGGQRIEGGLVEDKALISHVSFIPSIPYVHGMTFGELAQLIRDQYAPDFKKLTIVKMDGWSRDMVWDETGLAWVPTSPHIPHASTVPAYTATGILGELYVLSIGVGYTLPFELCGAPWLKADDLADAMNQHWNNPGHYYLSKAATRPAALSSLAPAQRPGSALSTPKGIYFRPARFKPFYSGFPGELCQGVQIHIDPKTAESLIEINFRLLQALDAPDLFAKAPKRHNMFDKVTGSPEARQILTEGKDLAPLFAKWRKTCDDFRQQRKQWLLY